MKKISLLIGVLLLVGLAFLLLTNPFTPESKKIRARIDAYVSEVKQNISSHPFWQIEYEGMRFDLAEAYIKENRPDEAIDILSHLIKKNKEPQFASYGQERGRISADYFFQELYYRALAEAFDLKDDKSGKKQALKKADQAKKAADILRPAEEAREARSKERERAALLN